MEQKKKVNEVDKGAIDAAVQQALDSDMPKPMPRPKARPTKVPRPKARPTINIGSDPKTGATRGIDPRDNYSPEDLKRLLMQSAMERMETEGKSLASLRNRSSFDAQDRMQDKNKPIKPKVVKPAQMDLFKEGAMSDLHARIMSSDDPHDAIYKMLTGDGPEEKYIQDMYNDTSAEYGLHPDDDFEDIIDRMVDEIEGDMAFEGYYVMPDIDKERYTPMDGLEGPFQTRAGKPIYYDPKEGAYYDRDTDMYLTYDEFKALDEADEQLKELSDEDRKEYYRSIKKSPGYKPIPGSGMYPPKDPIYKPIPGSGRYPDPEEPNDPGFGKYPGPPEKPYDPKFGKYPEPKPYKPIGGREGGTNDPLSRAEYQNLMKDVRLGRLNDDVAVRRDGKTLSKAEIAKLQRQGVLMKEDDYDQDTVKKNALEALVDIAKTAKKYKGGVTDEQIEILGGLIQDMDLAGIEPEKYSAVNELFKVMATDKKADMTMIQPAYAQVKKIDEDINEGEEKPYICVHAKKGKHECRAESSYAAAKKAAEHWGLKSTSGIDAHLAVDESMTLKNLTQPKRVIHTNKQNFRKNFAKRYTDMYPSTSTAEGHSPHKKGTKKYKAHMAAMHANEDVNQQYADVLKSKNQIKINAFLQGLDSATATRLTGGQAQTSKISSDGQSIRPSGDAYTHGKPGLSKQTIRMTKPVADRKYGESKLQDMRKALKLDESADANTVVAEYTRATLNHSYKTWKQVNEQITFIRSFVKEDVDVNAVATMLHKMHERENLDHKMLVKENVSKLRQIVKDKSAMSIKFADGSMKVDMTTASIFLQVFDKVKEETQAKIIDKIQTKAGFLSMLDLMYKKIG